MPLKNPDPFVSRAERLNATVNPYVALLRDASQDGSLPLAFGPQLTGFPGKWRQRIAEHHELECAPPKLVVEIGCHKGQTLLKMAEEHADTTFLGLDITYKRVVMTAQRAVSRESKNVFTALANAKMLDKLFAPGEVDGVVIFYPDPWVKKARQAKNRLVDDAFAARVLTVLAPGGFVWLKTDQQVYFDAAAESLDRAGLKRVGAGPGVAAGDYTSAFEQRFHAQNLPTWSGKWAKTFPSDAQAGWDILVK